LSIFTSINEIPIADLISENGLDEPRLPKNVGRSGAKIKCIFHSDDTPSWNIYPGDRQSYCFGCGKAHTSYDVLKYLDYTVEEMLDLAESYGIEIEREDSDQVSDEVNLQLRDWVSSHKDEVRGDRTACRKAEKVLKNIQNQRKQK
jgi:DNA primase